ncbi:hypothetical protein NsoK4_03395 [Nitrosopumilus sp. K4]|uniref:hypothetical protein n=1 Tax=Nitrosopumilus sp. K4 TaxID=2795383 RepID=UPI001BACF252|nr:hypothetical protein [Nitrosopumilus sp. K4]QUC65304.1 hypothetical protein NsoK4_03395 [Nitrosopumilus sp. K4]
MTVFILPNEFLSKEQFVPIPYLEAEISNSEIFLGESFRLNVFSENRGDYGDIHIVSAAFPTISDTEDIVEVVSYDFSHTPHYVRIGDEIGAKYSGGVEKITAQYPSIESMNRPIPSGSSNHVDFLITPDEVGPFLVYLKSIDIPHTDEKSHFPRSGQLDHQDEYVLVYQVNVNP